jgi:osmotically-inducible protein OsmY
VDKDQEKRKMIKRIVQFLALTLMAQLFFGCSDVNVQLNDNKNASQTANKNQKPAKEEANKNAGTELGRDEFEKRLEHYKQQAKEAGRKIGSGADDLWIWTKTRAALAYADDLRDSTIQVDVDKNVVTLSGSVANATQKTRAGEIAKGIDGVQTVVNQLQLSAVEKPAAKGKDKK